MKRANGMGTVVKMTGNRRKPWACRKVIGWKEDGRPILKYISYHKTKREAENALKRYNDDPYIVNNITFADLYKEWYEIQERDKKDGTLRHYRTRYAHLASIYDEKITDIDAIMLERVYNDLDVSKGMLESVQILVTLMIKYAVRRRYLPVSALNISKAINMPVREQKHNKPREVIAKTDIDRLWALKDTNEYAKIILVYIYTGLRYAELRDLAPENCHDNYIEIVDAKTPAGVRTVPICDKLKQVLPIIQVPPRTTFDRQYKLLLPQHAIHDTRHTFISMLTEKNVDVRVIKAIVGHKISDVTAIYTHISLDTMLDAVNML